MGYICINICVYIYIYTNIYRYVCLRVCMSVLKRVCAIVFGASEPKIDFTYKRNEFKGLKLHRALQAPALPYVKREFTRISVPSVCWSCYQN